MLLKGCEIVGVTWGGFLQRDLLRTRAHLDELVTLYNAGKVKAAGYRDLSSRPRNRRIDGLMERRVKGKIAIVP